MSKASLPTSPTGCCRGCGPRVRRIPSTIRPGREEVIVAATARASGRSRQSATRPVGAGSGTPQPGDHRRRPRFNEAVQHLHALCHRSLVYLDGPPNSWSAARKREVLERECARLGIDLLIHPTDGRPDFAVGSQAAAHLINTHATAVMTYNDQMAIGLLSALREAGIAVPDQLSVIGCDDSLPEGLAWPALTTVDRSAKTLGAQAAAAIRSPGRSMEAVPTLLTIRGSTAVRKSPTWA